MDCKMATIKITNTTCINFTHDVWDVFQQLNLGSIDTIMPYRDGDIYGFKIRFNTIDTIFHERLLSDYERETAGEYIVPPRIIYGKKRDGSDMFWYASLYTTEQPISYIRLPVSNPHVRIEM